MADTVVGGAVSWSARTASGQGLGVAERTFEVDFTLSTLFFAS
jgi:hypothetical protein